MNASQIVRETRLSRKRVDKWLRLAELPERNKMEPKVDSPAFFRDYLARRWKSGCQHVKTLMAELRVLGYTGCFSGLARFLSSWRNREQGYACHTGSTGSKERHRLHWASCILTCGCGASCKASPFLIAEPGTEGRCFKAVLPVFRVDAEFGHAVPRHSAIRQSRDARSVDRQSNELRYLLDEEICKDTSP